jgi:hypothetical protein
VVNVSIDRAGGQYWLKPVNNGQYWSIENTTIFFLLTSSADCGLHHGNPVYLILIKGV